VLAATNEAFASILFPRSVVSGLTVRRIASAVFAKTLDEQFLIHQAADF
jgi:hypothetical protein